MFFSKVLNMWWFPGYPHQVVSPVFSLIQNQVTAPPIRALLPAIREMARMEV